MYISYIFFKAKVKLKAYIITILLWTMLGTLLYFSKSCYEASMDAINLFIYTLLPAVFLFIFLTHLFIQLNLTSYLSMGFSKILSVIFGISKKSANVYLLGSIFGYPSGIKYATHLLENANISKKDYTKLLLFTNNPSITYILSGIGIGMFHNMQIGLILLFSITISNILIGICYRPKTNNNIIQQTEVMSNTFIKKKTTFLDNFYTSIKETFSSISFILIYIIVFSIMATIICKLLNLNSFYSSLVFGFLELTQGIDMIVKLSMDISIKIIIVAFVLGFSSLMVIMQLFSVSYKHISFKILFFAKFLQGILTSLISSLLIAIYPINYVDMPLFKNIEILQTFPHLPTCIIYILIILVFIILIVTKRLTKLSAVKGDNV